MSSTLPPIQPHTQAKHHILRYYLDEWFPILGHVYRSLRYIDGFSGPGEYQGGEPGSPLVALRAVREHKHFNGFAQAGKSIEFLFVDKDSEFCRRLLTKIRSSRWPRAFRIDVRQREFEDAMSELIEDVNAGRKWMLPTLIFVDPFGPAGFPMDLMAKLASFKRVEVLVNLNYSRFVQWILPDTSKHITADRLYGGPRWRPALCLRGRDRADFLVNEYEAALREVGWRGTSFEMVNVLNQTEYNLVYGTGSPKGLEAMKRAMRSASQTGEFRYTDRVDPAQPVFIGLDVEKEYPSEIGELLFRKYGGREIALEQLIEEEIQWHRWWLPADLRRALEYLEYGDDPRILGVRNSDGRLRIKRKYPDDCSITFGRPPQRRLL